MRIIRKVDSSHVYDTIYYYYYLYQIPILIIILITLFMLCTPPPYCSFEIRDFFFSMFCPISYSGQWYSCIIIIQILFGTNFNNFYILSLQLASCDFEKTNRPNVVMIIILKRSATLQLSSNCSVYIY